MYNHVRQKMAVVLNREQRKHIRSFLTSGVFLATLCIVLLLGIASYAAIHQAEESMARLLGEKGASLLSVCDSILRSGMRHRVGIRLQVLLEEMRSTSDIVFACVTMPDGTILAHSDIHRVGETLTLDQHEVRAQDMAGLHVQQQSTWKILHLEGHEVFAVYRYFSPATQHGLGTLPKPVIFLGLDLSPFSITRRQNRVYISILSGLSLLVLLASVAAFSFAGRARESLRRQKQAEGQIRELQEEVQRREKLAAVGSLAAGVAHEIRNPLSSIKGYATYFGERFAEGSEDRLCAEVMVHEVDRLSRVITDLIDLARPSDVKVHAMDPCALLAHVARVVLQDAKKQDVTVKIYTGKNLPGIIADQERLNQALLNLALNALHAMPDGGRLTLGVRKSMGGVTFFVMDTGCGIAREILPHIFDPYFTNHGGGTGLGLALVHKVVEAHQGTIQVRSRQKAVRGTRTVLSGTLFRVTIPRTPPTLPAR